MIKGKFVLIGISIIFVASLVIPKFIPYSDLLDSGDTYFWIYSTIAQSFAAMIALVAMFVVLAIQIWRTSRSDLIKDFRELIKKDRAYVGEWKTYDLPTGSERRRTPEEEPNLLTRGMGMYQNIAENSPDKRIIVMVKDWVEEIEERHKHQKKDDSKGYFPGEERLLQDYRILKAEENAYNEILLLLKRSLLWSGCIIGFSFIMLPFSNFISTWWNFFILVNVLGLAVMGIFVVIRDVWTIINLIRISIKST